MRRTAPRALRARGSAPAGQPSPSARGCQTPAEPRTARATPHTGVSAFAVLYTRPIYVSMYRSRKQGGKYQGLGTSVQRARGQSAAQPRSAGNRRKGSSRERIIDQICSN